MGDFEDFNPHLRILFEILFEHFPRLLRQFLESRFHPSRLHDVLKSNRESVYLKRLGPRVIDALATKSYDDLDLTSLFRIYRILSLGVDRDISLSVSLEAVVGIRNDLCHLANTNIKEETFTKYFETICKCTNIIENLLGIEGRYERKFHELKDRNLFTWWIRQEHAGGEPIFGDIKILINQTLDALKEKTNNMTCMELKDEYGSIVKKTGSMKSVLYSCLDEVVAFESVYTRICEPNGGETAPPNENSFDFQAVNAVLHTEQQNNRMNESPLLVDLVTPAQINAPCSTDGNEICLPVKPKGTQRVDDSPLPSEQRVANAQLSTQSKITQLREMISQDSIAYEDLKVCSTASQRLDPLINTVHLGGISGDNNDSNAKQTKDDLLNPVTARLASLPSGSNKNDRTQQIAINNLKVLKPVKEPPDKKLECNIYNHSDQNTTEGQLSRPNFKRERKKPLDCYDVFGLSSKYVPVPFEPVEVPLRGDIMIAHTEEDGELADHFGDHILRINPKIVLGIQGQVVIPGQFVFDIKPFLGYQYIFVLVTRFYPKSIARYNAQTLLLCSLTDRLPSSIVIPVLMENLESPEEFLCINPLNFYENVLKSKRNELILTDNYIDKLNLILNKVANCSARPLANSL